MIVFTIAQLIVALIIVDNIVASLSVFVNIASAHQSTTSSITHYHFIKKHRIEHK